MILDTFCHIIDTELHENECKSLWLNGEFTNSRNQTLSRWAEIVSSCAADWDGISEIEEYLGSLIRCWYDETEDKLSFTEMDDYKYENSTLLIAVFFGSLIFALVLGLFSGTKTKKRVAKQDEEAPLLGD